RTFFWLLPTTLIGMPHPRRLRKLVDRLRSAPELRMYSAERGSVGIPSTRVFHGPSAGNIEHPARLFADAPTAGAIAPSRPRIITPISFLARIRYRTSPGDQGSSGPTGTARSTGISRRRSPAPED